MRSHDVRQHVDVQPRDCSVPVGWTQARREKSVHLINYFWTSHLSKWIVSLSEFEAIGPIKSGESKRAGRFYLHSSWAEVSSANCLYAAQNRRSRCFHTCKVELFGHWAAFIGMSGAQTDQCGPVTESVRRLLQMFGHFAGTPIFTLNLHFHLKYTPIKLCDWIVHSCNVSTDKHLEKCTQLLLFVLIPATSGVSRSLMTHKVKTLPANAVADGNKTNVNINGLLFSAKFSQNYLQLQNVQSDHRAVQTVRTPTIFLKLQKSNQLYGSWKSQRQSIQQKFGSRKAKLKTDLSLHSVCPTLNKTLLHPWLHFKKPTQICSVLTSGSVPTRQNDLWINDSHHGDDHVSVALKQPFSVHRYRRLGVQTA